MRGIRVIRIIMAFTGGLLGLLGLLGLVGLLWLLPDGAYFSKVFFSSWSLTAGLADVCEGHLGY